ncbi:hypothetical protein H2199_001025 [Coniosporium tulheliwenetii]|uniref:Uncharacterized protein n=1 Tax=Coniosporium tulheliwenetii TaxID=3383036 RepID=A0ACC2ZNI3_9PEZI|nr:hypothetical protein H2199_001025 [Cladosporium sp. JES 115]
MATPSAETPSSSSSRASIDIKQDLDDKSAPWTGSPTLLEEMLDQLLWNEPYKLETEAYVLSEYKSRPQRVDAERGKQRKARRQEARLEDHLEDLPAVGLVDPLDYHLRIRCIRHNFLMVD